MNPTQVFALIHVHTTESDGSADADYIASQAARAGVEAVVLTDHNCGGGPARYINRALVIQGEEVTPRYNHILALGLRRPFGLGAGGRRHGSPGEVCKEVSLAGGWTALAHPLDSHLPALEKTLAYPCMDFSQLEHDGLELWNLLSAFKRDLLSFRLGLARVLFPRAFLAGPHPMVLSLWDTVGRRRCWPALGGADAHAFRSRRWWLPVRIFSYQRHMRLITTGIWLEKPFSGDPEQDSRLVLEALARGRCFAALGRARGFECLVEAPGGGALRPGQESPFTPGLRMRVSLPARGRAALMKDGRQVESAVGKEFSFDLGSPGVWRIEVRKHWPFSGWRPWIYCNPFYLREGATT